MISGTQYTRERLTEAARRCADIDEVIAYFGTRPYGRLRRPGNGTQRTKVRNWDFDLALPSP